MNIELDSFLLTRYSEDKHKKLKDELENGVSQFNFIHQIGKRLENSKDNNRNIYQSAFVVEFTNIPIGYLYISNMVNDEVFLEYSILKEYRGKGYGSNIIREITDYLFEKHNIRSIRLDIDPSNRNSINVAQACGYAVDEDEFESRNYIGRMQFVRENAFYVSKRRARK